MAKVQFSHDEIKSFFKPCEPLVDKKLFGPAYSDELQTPIDLSNFKQKICTFYQRPIKQRPRYPNRAKNYQNENLENENFIPQFVPQEDFQEESFPQIVQDEYDSQEVPEYVFPSTLHNDHFQNTQEKSFSSTTNDDYQSQDTHENSFPSAINNNYQPVELPKNSFPSSTTNDHHPPGFEIPQSIQIMGYPPGFYPEPVINFLPTVIAPIEAPQFQYPLIGVPVATAPLQTVTQAPVFEFEFKPEPLNEEETKQTAKKVEEEEEIEEEYEEEEEIEEVPQKIKPGHKTIPTPKQIVKTPIHNFVSADSKNISHRTGPPSPDGFASISEYRALVNSSQKKKSFPKIIVTEEKNHKSSKLKVNNDLFPQVLEEENEEQKDVNNGLTKTSFAQMFEEEEKRAKVNKTPTDSYSSKHLTNSFAQILEAEEKRAKNHQTETKVNTQPNKNSFAQMLEAEEKRTKVNKATNNNQKNTSFSQMLAAEEKRAKGNKSKMNSTDGKLKSHNGPRKKAKPVVMSLQEFIREQNQPNK
ncbi:hypothetical protein GPJ56_000313 [Histomonas meleagridis]|uniref:uncharacterized protein n=1 Tax=Histomonas meleagridis TaxID=135588 RepID=UPI00355A9AFA|nr:hypothetical protein GPJ56_000313 [Histomonas meleagridis]KAH0798414.1 hypothetical protein GO595_008806 [Histomonas meleagridis]